LELGCVHYDWLQALARKRIGELRRKKWSDEPATGGYAIADELQSIVFADDVDTFAILLNGLVRLRRERCRMDENGFGSQRREARVEMVEA